MEIADVLLSVVILIGDEKILAKNYTLQYIIQNVLLKQWNVKGLYPFIAIFMVIQENTVVLFMDAMIKINLANQENFLL